MPVMAVNRRQDIDMNTTKGKKQMQTKPEKKLPDSKAGQQVVECLPKHVTGSLLLGKQIRGNHTGPQLSAQEAHLFCSNGQLWASLLALPTGCFHLWCMTRVHGSLLPHRC